MYYLAKDPNRRDIFIFLEEKELGRRMPFGIGCLARLLHWKCVATKVADAGFRTTKELDLDEFKNETERGRR
ncbi:MAG: hypothetical protein AB7V22_01335 [Kiritimatiellia bacterium]